MTTRLCSLCDVEKWLNVDDNIARDVLIHLCREKSKVLLEKSSKAQQQDTRHN